MLNIDKKVDGKNIELVLSGRIDTTTAPELDKAIQEIILSSISLTLTTSHPQDSGFCSLLRRP